MVCRALCSEVSAVRAGHGQVRGCARLQGRLSWTACTKNNCKSHVAWVPREIHCRKDQTTEKTARWGTGRGRQPSAPQRVGKPPRWVPPRPPLKLPRSPRKLVLFLSLPLSPRPAEVPPLPPPLGAPPPRSDLDLGGGDLGRSLSISSVQPVRWELGAVKYEEYVSALKLLFVRVGPTVSQPREQNCSQQKQQQTSRFKATVELLPVNEHSGGREKQLPTHQWHWTEWKVTSTVIAKLRF